MGAHGTWKQDGGGYGPALAVGAAVVVAAATVGAGKALAADVAPLVRNLLVAAGIIVGVAVAAAVTLLGVYLRRTSRPAPPPPWRAEVVGSGTPAGRQPVQGLAGDPAPVALPPGPGPSQAVHFHIGAGADAEVVEAAIRAARGS